ncbi:RHS repeat domain-containing protein [Shimia sediminis]|uniref:RHS repeat domain-containing protein n=1 Tax=Shimia sediminis TaxID=2497945 RepID=UPI000F8D606A|nr:RHS repeat-associated core domain-containing protein [Shimia sediminis]
MYFIRTDHIGKPVLATDALGVVASTISHKPFGEMHTSTGLDTGLRFPGQVYHWESELHQNWMRDYDPTTGRYIQGDPLGLVDGASVYAYALQSPGRYVDPRGESVKDAAKLLCAMDPKCWFLMRPPPQQCEGTSIYDPILPPVTEFKGVEEGGGGKSTKCNLVNSHTAIDHGGTDKLRTACFYQCENGRSIATDHEGYHLCETPIWVTL